MEKRYQVFISATFKDLEKEREAIIKALLDAKYIPATMEYFLASSGDKYEYIKKVIDTCDYFVMVSAGIYGNIQESTNKSFTEIEYDYAKEKGIPILSFLYDYPFDLPCNKRDDENRAELIRFRQKVSNEGNLYREWHNITDLALGVISSLNEEVRNNPQCGWIRGKDATDIIVSHQIDYINKELVLKLNKESKDVDNVRIESVFQKINTFFLKSVFNDIQIIKDKIKVKISSPELIDTSALVRYVVDRISSDKNISGEVVAYNIY